MNAKLHISPKSEENFLSTQTLEAAKQVSENRFWIWGKLNIAIFDDFQIFAAPLDSSTLK